MVMADLYVFDDKRSIFHFVLGLVLYSICLPNFSLITELVTLVFIIYEATEPENPIGTLGDFVEFILGAIMGLAMAVH